MCRDLDNVGALSRWTVLIPYVYECSATGKFAMRIVPAEMMERTCAKDCVDTDAEVDRILNE